MLRAGKASKQINAVMATDDTLRVYHACAALQSPYDVADEVQIKFICCTLNIYWFGENMLSETTETILTLGRPLPNAVLLGGFAALSGLITLDAVGHAIRAKFAGKVAEANVAAAAEAYDFVKKELKELAHAQAD